MVGLQALYLGNALKHPSISGGIGLKLFCPWFLKLGGNMETTAIHLHEVHYWMAITCDICFAFASMTMQNIQDHWSEGKEKHNKECLEHARKGSEVPRLEKGMEVSQVKGSI